MSLEIYRYTLKSRGPLNATSTRSEFPGALLRDPTTGGVGCLHPWPELGDASLDEQLSLLSKGTPTRQTALTLSCIETDGAARVEHRSLFDGLRIPRSHWTAGPDDLPEEVDYPFDTVKLKTGPDLETLVRQVRDWFSFALRLDFNATGSPEFIRELQSELGDDWERIDFIEDPFPSSEEWATLQTELAVNFAADREHCHHAVVSIHKPAIEAPPSGRTICTSYMDHAVGQLWAAFQSASISPDETCGLLTHHLFEPDDFFSELSHTEARLVPPAGTGLGFDETLNRLPWKPLT